MSASTSKQLVPRVPENINFPAEEEKILKYWKDIKAFETCLKQSKGKPKYVFCIFQHNVIDGNFPFDNMTIKIAGIVSNQSASQLFSNIVYYRYTFYDGPPFATGLPHYGHILAGTIKDVVTRYAHQQGYHVERRFGWDTHGLPVEFEIDKALNIKGPEDVMKIGIRKYNEECRSIVTRYCSEWEYTISRLGRWIGTT